MPLESADLCIGLMSPDSGTSLWSLGLAITLAGLASMIFAYCYFLLLNFSRVKLLQLANGNGNGGKKKIEGCLDNYTRILNAVVAIEITSKILFILCSYIIIRQAFDLAITYSLACSLVLSAAWFIFFCRILPAEIGSRYEEQVLLIILPFLNGLSKYLSPVLFPLDLYRKIVRRFLRSSSRYREAEHYAEEIMDAVEEGEREGALREDEAEMIESIVELHASEVSEIMTPRMDIVCADIKIPAEEVLSTALETGHSRIPVFEGTRDRIVGILYVKDLLKYWSDKDNSLPLLSKLLRKPFFIPETKNISHLLSEFRENKVHMAIVLDEYGGTAGLVTNEDVLEEIVGEIVDEYDQEEDELKRITDGRAEASAKVHIDELNDKLEINLPESEDFDTLGGFIFARLGRVPVAGDTVRHENVLMTVIDADQRRIKRVSLEITELEEDK